MSRKRKGTPAEKFLRPASKPNTKPRQQRVSASHEGYRVWKKKGR